MNTRAGETGFTPLHLAAIGGSPAVVRMLLAKGADPDAKDGLGETPLEQAARLDQIEVVDLLLPPGAAARSDLLSGAVVKGQTDLVKVLLEHGAEVNARSSQGATPLDDAALKGRVEVARLLLQHGADVKARNSYGGTPLHDAALGGHADVVELLLENGAAIDARDDSGATPLYQAAAWGRLEVVDLLLRKGADAAHSGARRRHSGAGGAGERAPGCGRAARRRAGAEVTHSKPGMKAFTSR